MSRVASGQQAVTPPVTAGSSKGPAPRPRSATGRAVDCLTAIQSFHRAHGVNDRVNGMEDLFPPNWALGRTTLTYRETEESKFLKGALPTIKAYDKKGREQARVVVSGDHQTTRLVATWPSPVDITRAILSYKSGGEVSKEQLVELAQRSPEALEKLKACGKAWKGHLTRLLDMTALRRDPQFNEVAMRYKAQLRALIDEQMAAVMAQRAATKRVNDCLAERDAALARLDPSYTPKKLTARAALARFGIDIDEKEEMTAAAQDLDPDVLAELDF